MYHFMHICFYRSTAANSQGHLPTPFVISTGPLCWYPYHLTFQNDISIRAHHLILKVLNFQNVHDAHMLRVASTQKMVTAESSETLVVTYVINHKTTIQFTSVDILQFASTIFCLSKPQTLCDWSCMNF
jgi:hypothetical protein